MKMTDDFLSREYQDRPTTIWSGEAELPDLPPVYFGHRWALRMGSNSSGVTGWRLYPSRCRRTFSSSARRLNHSSKASRITSERRRRSGFTAASTVFKRDSSIRMEIVFAMRYEYRLQHVLPTRFFLSTQDEKKLLPDTYLRRAMRVGQQEFEVGEDLLDDRGLVNECDDPHRAATAGAQQGIGLIHLFDQPNPLLLECPAWRGRRDLDDRV